MLEDPAEVVDDVRITEALWESVLDIYFRNAGSIEESLETAYVYIGKRQVVRHFDPVVRNKLKRLIDHVCSAHGRGLQADTSDPGEKHFEVFFEERRFRAFGRFTRSKSWLINLRRLPQRVPDLSELSYPRFWKDILLHRDLLAGGFIVVAARTGQGKTTTVGGGIGTRLRRFGGFGGTVEEVIEMPLSLEHYPDGVCEQHPVSTAAEFESALADQLRGFPTFQDGGTQLLVGETRTNGVAVECLRHALNGHLVWTTIHAESVPSALMRLHTMAASQLGDKAAADLLASALRVVIHQTFRYFPEREGFKRGEYGGTMLCSFSSNSKLANTIRELNWKGLEQVMEDQRKCFEGDMTFPEALKRLKGLS